MNLRQRLGKNVQRIRKDKSWSQEEFAHRCGLHRTYISQVERGVRNPTITVLEKLAKALKVEPAHLLS